MRVNPAAVANLNAGADHAIWSDLHVAAQLGAGIDYRCWMNPAHPRGAYASSTSIAEISAWATNFPSTVASPCIFQNEPRRFRQVSSIRS